MDATDSPAPTSEFLTQHYPVVQRAIRAVARRHHLTQDERDELCSIVSLKLVERDYDVLRKFQGRSSLMTYLTKVVDRTCLDIRVAREGRWRPSVTARRLGATAIRLERLILRDQVPFDEACQVLRTNFRARESVAELERIRERLPYRTRVRHVAPRRLDEMADVQAHDPEVHVIESHHAHVHRTVLRAMTALSPAERRMLALRFNRGWTITRIAGELGTDRKTLYRTFARIYRNLRRSVGSARPSGWLGR